MVRQAAGHGSTSGGVGGRERGTRAEGRKDEGHGPGAVGRGLLPGVPGAQPIYKDAPAGGPPGPDPGPGRASLSRRSHWCRGAEQVVVVVVRMVGGFRGAGGARMAPAVIRSVLNPPGAGRRRASGGEKRPAVVCPPSNVLGRRVVASGDDASPGLVHR